MYKNVLRKLLIIFLSFVAAFSPIEVVAADLLPLTQAILIGDYTEVARSLRAGASPNAIDPAIQHTPLYLGVAPGGPRDAEIVATLAQSGARLDTLDPQSQLTPLMAAMVVTERGPFAITEANKAAQMVRELLQLGANPNQALAHGETPLMVAVGLGNLAIVEALLGAGANVRAQDAQGATPLKIAYGTGQSQDIINALLAAGAAPDAKDSPTQQTTTTPVAEPTASTTAVAPQKSPWGKWLIGGALVATAVIGAVVLSNYSEQQKRDKANALAAAALASATSSQAAGTTNSGNAVTPSSSGSTTLAGTASTSAGTPRIKDFGVLSAKLDGGRAAERVLLGSGTSIDSITFMPGDQVTLYIDVDEPLSAPFNVRMESTAKSTTPLPSIVSVNPLPAGTLPSSTCARLAREACPLQRATLTFTVGRSSQTAVDGLVQLIATSASNKKALTLHVPPPTESAAAQLVISSATLNPPKPAAGQSYTVNVKLYNAFYMQTNLGGWRIESATGRTLMATRGVNLAKGQSNSYQSPPLVHNGEATTLNVYSSGLAMQGDFRQLKVPAASAASSSPGSGATAQSNSEAAKACAAETYLGAANDPQFDTLCKLAQFDACIHRATGLTIYDAEGRAQCKLLDAVIQATPGKWACRYCPFPY